MYLYLDNSTDGEVDFRLALNTKIIHTVFTIEKNQSLLELIEKFISGNGFLKEDLKGVAIVVGKGRFTSTRVAVATANTLAYAFNIPVLAVSDFKDEIFEDLKKQISGQYVSAEYSGAANIGSKK